MNRRLKSTIYSPNPNHPSVAHVAPLKLTRIPSLRGNRRLPFALLLLCLFLAAPAHLLAAPASGASSVLQAHTTPVERFIAFVTEFPPIENMVGEWAPRSQKQSTFFQFRFYPSQASYDWMPNSVLPDPTYRFRFKPSAFFAREGTSPQDLEKPLSFSNRAASVWNDEYWFLEPESPKRSALHTYHHTSRDWGNALAGYAHLMTTFSLFATFGISELGAGSVVRGDKTHLEFIHPSGRFPVTLDIVDGLPGRALFRRPSGNDIIMNVTISYEYDINVAPLGIPVGWNWEGNLRGRLHKLDLGDGQRPLPQAVFATPYHLLTNRELSHFVRTNKHDYQSRGGIMERIDLGDTAMSPIITRPRNRKYYLMVAGIFSLLIVPALLAINRQKKKTTKTHNTL